MKEDLRKVCWIVNQALGKSQYTYPMYQNAPRPDGDFAAVRLRKSFAPQVDVSEVVTKDDGTLVSRTYASRILTFDVLFNVEDINVHLFDSSFYRQDVIDKCNAEGFGYLRKEPTKLENTTLETDWELRTGITVEFHTLRFYDVPMDAGKLPVEFHDIKIEVPTTIEEAIIEGEVTGDEGNIVNSYSHIKSKEP